ncbi:PepSY domain-containing protein [uncultured Anaerococcus sp.]|uniref:PepSY domain-containing protein n=1 Tax=uncultured Anaerococcus sp. TaxID=293428 RepID=UPI00288B7E6C|nr:PepSY domain-containing protein [uncultured Anaerococcus sp.]
MSKKLLALTLALGLVLGGCGKAKDTNLDPKDTNIEKQVEDFKDTSKDDDGNVKASEKTSSPNINEVKINLNASLAKFEEVFADKDIAIEEVKLELENGTYLYKFEGKKENKEYSLSFDANTGDIKAQKEEEDKDKEQIEAIDFSKIISPKEAIDKAIAGQDGAKVVEWSLKTDDGKTKYEIDIENGTDKEVDALTGEVVDD